MHHEGRIDHLAHLLPQMTAIRILCWVTIEFLLDDTYHVAWKLAPVLLFVNPGI